ncbi:phosphotransferase [Pelagibius litoralis]|uniref:Phosphotransferase n=1 Tax=Pelagibius litoralis TaxID=374515 RepID=A0A967C4B0_9PROT|nr:phosphotransferase [Pelagibius litoralis]
MLTGPELETLKARVRGLPLWSGPVALQRLEGGITNVNFHVVDDSGDGYVVRLGDDIPVHHVMRFNEAAASRAAAVAGVSPDVVYTEPGVLVVRFVEGRTLGEADLRSVAMLDRFIPLLIKVHRDVGAAFRGAALTFWPFHVLRDYGRSLREGDSRHLADLPALLGIAEKLEAAVGDITMVFGHNDLLPGNILDDGRRLWLIDWDYAGFGSPLFDLANLATNCGLDEKLERHLLESYFEAPATDALYRRFAAMKCASLLRETLWSMVSEIHSSLDFDYAGYTVENRARFARAHDAFMNL